MDKEPFYKRLTEILEDFDSDRKADMQPFIDRIYSASEIFFADVIEFAKKDAVRDFLIKELKKLPS